MPEIPKFGEIKQMKSKIDIINETVEFYGADPSRRAIMEVSDNMGRCAYSAGERHCGVGRCMTENGQIRVVNIGLNVSGVDELHNTAEIQKDGGLDSLLKPEYRGHSLEFWQDIQGFHDGGFWTKTGLKEAGCDMLMELREKYAEN